MNLEIKETDGILTGVLSGYIDTATSEQVGQEMEPLLKQANRAIEIDCSKLEYISSSGLRLLLSLRKQVAADGGSLVIRNINDEIRKVFTLTGFFKLFDIR
ncbi:MAG: STAS domain-containing protein [Prevotella sp.]|jgi:anti-anti-sigma factor|nr:STAS domain-containing protein [Prevotella sp.]